MTVLHTLAHNDTAGPIAVAPESGLFVDSQMADHVCVQCNVGQCLSHKIRSCKVAIVCAWTQARRMNTAQLMR